jgi:hypothetical protein
VYAPFGVTTFCAAHEQAQRDRPIQLIGHVPGKEFLRSSNRGPVFLNQHLPLDRFRTNAELQPPVTEILTGIRNPINILWAGRDLLPFVQMGKSEFRVWVAFTALALGSEKDIPGKTCLV